MKSQRITVMKGIYLCLLTAYAILREVMIIQRIVGSAFVTYGFFLLGIAIIGLCLLQDHRPYFHRNQWPLYLFLLCCILSTVWNLQVVLFSNGQAIAWLVLYFFLLVPGGWDQEGEKKIWEWVMITSVTILTLLSLIALPMYFFDVGYSYIRESGFLFYQGFSTERLRLWGLYADPNTAGVYNMVAVCFIGYFLQKTQRVWLKILLLLCCVPLVVMTILGNSRTVLVACVVTAGWIAFYLCCTFQKEKRLKNVAISVLAMVMAAAVAISAFSAVKTAMPHLKAAIQLETDEKTNAAVHAVYDRGFQWSGLNVSQGYYGAHSANQEVSEVPVEPSQPNQTVQNGTDTIQQEEKSTVEVLERTDLQADISNGRFEIWRDVLVVARYNLLFGTSPRGISQAAREVAPGGYVAMYDYAAHNSMLEVLAGTGLAGFSVIMGLLVWMAAIILRSTFSERFQWQIAIYGTTLLLIVCEMMFISDVFFNLTFGGIAFWMASGRILEYGDNHVAKKEGDQ